MAEATLSAGAERRGNALEVLAVATRLGLTSFGGPVAHLGYFREEYVVRRRWLDDRTYAEVVALCQALPGPASSQVGIAIGLLRAGLPGALCAWLGFTLPSAIALVLFAYGLDEVGDVRDAGWLHGLQVAAVAIVGYAVWGMARALTSDKERASLAIAAAVVILAWESALAQIVLIAAGGAIGWRLLRSPQWAAEEVMAVPRPVVALTALALFFGLLVALPVADALIGGQALALFDSFFRVGSLVFGGGHVVLPLLETEVVGPGWVNQDDFLAGYGAAQAVPGPLFTFSAFLGASMGPEPNGVAGAMLALVAIFLPSFLLVPAGLAAWGFVRRSAAFHSALAGVNAVVVGLLLAALYDPVWTSAIGDERDFALALGAFGLLAFWKLPPWLIVVLAALGGEALSLTA